MQIVDWGPPNTNLIKKNTNTIDEDTNKIDEDANTINEDANTIEKTQIFLQIHSSSTRMAPSKYKFN